MPFKYTELWYDESHLLSGMNDELKNMVLEQYH